jgi:steroid delta-isomerase-like uncharacterized protein
MRQRLILLLTLVLALGATTATVLAQATPAVTETEANKALIRQLYDNLNAHDMAGIAQLFSPDAVDHDPAPGQPAGPEGVVGAFAVLEAGFPDLRVSVEQLIAEDDIVVDRILGLGTNTGSFAGIPPTGKPAAIEAIHIYRIENGQIAELWHIEDLASVMGQLGVIPGAPPAGPPATPAVLVPTATGPVEPATVEANKDLLRRMFDAVNAADVATLDSMFSPDFFNHNPNPGFPSNWEGLKATMLSFREPFPDQVTTVNQVIGEGDLVVVHVTVRGTMEGAAYSVPPCNCKVDYDGINIVRVENGLIVENWSIYEVVSLLFQIGAIPGGAPPAGGTPPAAASPIASPQASTQIDWSAYSQLAVQGSEAGFEAPDSIEGGLVAMTFENTGTSGHMAMLIRPAEGVTIDELETAIKTDPLNQVTIREMVVSPGGAGAIAPGMRQRLILDVDPGQYLLADFEFAEDGTPFVALNGLKRLEVTPSTKTDQPEPAFDAAISQIDFVFVGLPQQLGTGTYIFKVTTDGTEPHELGLVKLDEGVTAQQAFSQQPQPGEPWPFTLWGGVQDMSPEQTVWVEIDFSPGNYVAFCQIIDPTTGRPHVMLGMVQEVLVE